VLGDRIGNKSGPDGIHVPVTIAALLVGIEALRQDHVQMILGARHRDIEEPSFLLVLGAGDAHVLGGANSRISTIIAFGSGRRTGESRGSAHD
jgi:hypothetical protein